MDMIMETMGKTSGEETKEDKSMEDQRKEIENREDDEMEIDLVLLFRAFLEKLYQTVVAGADPDPCRSRGLLCFSESEL